MPQMKPMNWLIYFLSFTLLLISINILNYFLNNNNNNKKLNKKSKLMNFMNWKW